MSKKKRIYISGKITDTPMEEYMNKFQEAQDFLESKGYDVINPAKVNHYLPPDSTHYREYIDMSLCMLRQADYIYLLKDWHSSKGATLEMYFALCYGISILYQEMPFDSQV